MCNRYMRWWVMISSKERGEVKTGTADWQVYLDSAYYIKCKEINCNSGGFCEDIDFRKEPVGWKETGYVCRKAGREEKEKGYWWDTKVG